MPELLSGTTATIGAVGKIAGTIAGIGPVKAWLHGCKTRVVAGRLMPRNHDLVKGVRTAHLCALDHVTRCYTKLLTTLPDHEIGSDDHAFASNLRVFIDERLTLLNDKNIDHDVLTADDIDHVLEHLTHAATHESYAELSDEAQEGCETGALKEIADDAGRQPPALFVRIFKGEHGNAGWYEAFSLFVTEELKTNERFRSIFFSTKLGDIGRTLDELSNRTLKDFPDLSDFMNVVKRQLDRMEAKLDAIQENVAKLLVTALAKNDELSRKLEDANVNQQKVMAIARRTALNINDFDQALAELESHAEIAIEVEREGRSSSNLGEFVDAVLARVREKYDANDFDAAAAEADKGFVEWEREEAKLKRREAERQTASLQKGLKILEIGLQQDILRRNAQSAARRIIKTSVLKHPDSQSDQLATLASAFDEWFDRGRDKGLNFDLEIAIEIATLGLNRASGQDQRGYWQNKLAVALSTLGERESGKNRLELAVLAYKAALVEFRPERAPLQWAGTQNNLGNTLKTLGERESGTKRLKQSVAAFQSALEQYRQNRMPIEWQRTQNNLANALSALGLRESGTERLEQAVVTYQSALKKKRRDREPIDWAITQSNLGTVLRVLGERESGTERLTQAVAAFQSALQELTRDCRPLQWAGVQSNLGNALSTIGERESGTERLEQAIAAYEAALEEYRRDRVPLDWAMTQNNLGAALRTLGAREHGTTRLEQAIIAYQSALEVRQRDLLPLDWAMTQNNLGNALQTLGERESGTERLEQAVTAYKSALDERRQDRVPLDWAMTQYNLGNALLILGTRDHGTTRLVQAVASYQSALEEYRQDRVPLDWAITLVTQATALRIIAERTSDIATAKQALGQLETAVETLKQSEHTTYADLVEGEEQRIQALLLQLGAGN